MAILDTLTAAESFISGFEGDELQTGIDGLLTSLRNEIASHKPATPEQIEAARQTFADDDLQIADGASVSLSDGGYWVAAWVWVATDDEGAAQ